MTGLNKHLSKMIRRLEKKRGITRKPWTINQKKTDYDYDIWRWDNAPTDNLKYIGGGY